MEGHEHQPEVRLEWEHGRQSEVTLAVELSVVEVMDEVNLKPG